MTAYEKEIHELLDKVAAEDGVAPLSEAFVRRIGQGPERIEIRDGRPVAYAAHDGATQELCVDPAYRRRGLAQALHFDGVPMWSHGDLAPARGLAEKLGLKVVRELLVMRAPLVAGGGELPQGWEATAYADIDSPAVDQAWLAANNQAFHWHPEQGGWDLARLEHAKAAWWFRPEDVLLVHPAGNPEEVVGFHWLKLIEGQPAETFVIGLGDSARGKGLGTPLMQLGMQHAIRRGFTEIELYVEGDNAPAVNLYRSLGFETAQRHVLYGN